MKNWRRKMKPLIDADVLLYEVGFMGEYSDEGGEGISSFERVADLLADRVRIICEEVGATESPTLYITLKESMLGPLNRKRKWEGLGPIGYAPNFREKVAVTKPYKGTRKTKSPFHFKNLFVHMIDEYDTKIANGIEADDLLAIDQTEDTVICSRDKDLRMVEGWHYSWECGRQPAKGPTFVKGIGWLEGIKSGKLVGYGPMFFYSQMLTGDVVDNISGLPKWGPKKTLEFLNSIEEPTERKLYVSVRDLYKEVFGEGWKINLVEQANLLWMVRKLDEEGGPVKWLPPKED